MNSHKAKTLVDLDHVSVVNNEVEVLSDISLCIHSGQSVAVIGPNGAGKTTLLKAMLKIIMPSSGDIFLGTSHIGYVAQDNGEYSGIIPLSVSEVVGLGCDNNSKKINECLERVGLLNLKQRSVSNLSGGQKQRVQIAKALAENAELLILDEPTAGIDQHSQNEFYGLIDELNANGTTIVIVAHEIELVSKHCRRLIIVNQKLLYDGPTEGYDISKHMPEYYRAEHKQHHGGRG